MELKEAIAHFREWAENYPREERSGDWECGYPDWGQLYGAVLDFIEIKPPRTWTTEQWECVLYAIARDNEAQYLASCIGERSPQILCDLARAALEQGESDTKWQLAVELGRTGGFSADVEELLLRMADDTKEYVRRHALMTLARLDSPHTEALALAAWQRPDGNQQWARMAALWSLHRIQSSHLERWLTEAEADPRPYLSEYAQRLRRGDVED